MEIDADFSFAVRERVLHRIRQQLLQNQSARHCLPHLQLHVHLQLELNRRRLRDIRVEEIPRQFFHVIRKINPRQIIQMIELLMHQRHRTNPVAAFIQRLMKLAIFKPLRLQRQQARNNLQIVLNPVLHFLEQDIFLLDLYCKVCLKLLRHEMVPQILDVVAS